MGAYPAWVGITVLIVDDQAMVRQGFAALLAAQPDITVVGDAVDGQQALAAAPDAAPTSS